MFRIEDERHAEPQVGEFASFDDAVGELRRRALIPWDEEPNQAPCSNWRNCGRSYEIVEYDESERPWREINRMLVLEIDAHGANWTSVQSQSPRTNDQR